MKLNGKQLQILGGVFKNTLAGYDLNSMKDICVNFYQAHTDHKVTFQELTKFKNDILPLERKYGESIITIQSEELTFTLSGMEAKKDRIQYTYTIGKESAFVYSYFDLQYFVPNLIDNFFKALIHKDVHYLTNTYLQFSEKQTPEELYHVFLTCSKAIETLFVVFVDANLPMFNLTSNYTQKGLIAYSYNEGSSKFLPLINGRPLNNLFGDAYGTLAALHVGDTRYFNNLLEELADIDSMMIMRFLNDELIIEEVGDYPQYRIHLFLQIPEPNKVTAQVHTDIIHRRKFNGTLVSFDQEVINCFTQVYHAMHEQDPAFFGFFSNHFNGISDPYEIRAIALNLISVTQSIQNAWNALLASLVEETAK